MINYYQSLSIIINHPQPWSIMIPIHTHGIFPSSPGSPLTLQPGPEVRPGPTQDADAPGRWQGPDLRPHAQCGRRTGHAGDAALRGQERCHPRAAETGAAGDVLEARWEDGISGHGEMMFGWSVAWCVLGMLLGWFGPWWVSTQLHRHVLIQCYRLGNGAGWIMINLHVETGTGMGFRRCKAPWPKSVNLAASGTGHSLDPWIWNFHSHLASTTMQFVCFFWSCSAESLCISISWKMFTLW